MHIFLLEEDKSNQFLQNDGASQKLSRDEIMDLKAQGVSGKVKKKIVSINWFYKVATS